MTPEQTKAMDDLADLAMSNYAMYLDAQNKLDAIQEILKGSSDENRVKQSENRELQGKN